MAPTRYFGPETVDLDQGGVLVRELKAATCFIIGTAPIHEVHETAEARAPYINKKIILRRRQDIAGHFGPHRDGYTLPQKLEAMFTKARTRGIGTIVVVNVFDPAKHQDDEGNPDPSKVTALDIIGAFDAAGKPSGLKLAYSCYQSFGWFPKIVFAPGFDSMAGVRSELQSICQRIRGRYLLDAPLGATVQAVIEARGPLGSFNFQTNDPRAVGCWPHMMTVNQDETSPNAGKPIPDQYSAHFAGMWLMSIMEYGYHHSPSNRPIQGGIEEAAQEVLYIPGDASSDIQLLRGAGIVACEERYGKGPHTAGNRSLAYPTVTHMRNFMHVQFKEDILDEAILHYLDEWKDRNGNPASIELIEDDINAYGIAKTIGRDPQISGFEFRFNRQKTTVQSVADGHFYWRREWAPIGVMERLTEEKSININLLGDPLGLATSQAPELA